MKVTIDVFDFITLYEIVEDLVEWEKDPDRYTGDLADLATRARLFIEREE
jgi:hypothetical protein